MTHMMRDPLRNADHHIRVRLLGERLSFHPMTDVSDANESEVRSVLVGLTRARIAKLKPDNLTKRVIINKMRQAPLEEAQRLFSVVSHAAILPKKVREDAVKEIIAAFGIKVKQPIPGRRAYEGAEARDQLRRLVKARQMQRGYRWFLCTRLRRNWQHNLELHMPLYLRSEGLSYEVTVFPLHDALRAAYIRVSCVEGDEEVVEEIGPKAVAFDHNGLPYGIHPLVEEAVQRWVGPTQFESQKDLPVNFVVAEVQRHRNITEQEEAALLKRREERARHMHHVYDEEVSLRHFDQLEEFRPRFRTTSRTQEMR